jgi:ABC-type molybdate transport system substrate-binding protein
MAKALNFTIGSLLAAWLATVATTALADDIKVLCDRSLEAPLNQLLPSFHMATGHVVSVSADTATGLRERLEKGEAADAIIVAKDVLDEFERAHLTVPGARIDLVRSASTGVSEEGDRATDKSRSGAMYTGGLVMHTQVAPAATSFIRYLASKAGREAFVASGLVPAAH